MSTFDLNSIDEVITPCCDVEVKTSDIGDKLKKCPKIDVFDVAPILSEAINRLKTGDSISELFK